MPRADLVLKLIQASRRGDDRDVRKAVEALAADERAKNHTILADRMLAQLQGGNGKPNPASRVLGRFPTNSLVAEITPTRCLDDLILPTEAEEAVRMLVTEQHRVDLLRSYSLEPRHRILLAGPPGNGKTTLAEAIATSLMFPLLVVRYEAVIGSFLGETSQRIEKVFELARSRRCVLFFDEFDSVGKERGDVHETGEIKRVVSSLLLQLDSLPSHTVVVAATNHPQLLDYASWRRFEIRLELPLPTKSQIETWFERFEERSGQSLGLEHSFLARRLHGHSYAEVEQFGTDILREIVLTQPDSDPIRITKRRLTQWENRFKPNQEPASFRRQR